ncbi:MAG: hypothetical protein ACRDY1_13770 [Acidimicrobiales bacterium]
MTLGDRCDDIVRLIDETLVSIAGEPETPVDTSAHPSGSALKARGAPPLRIVAGGRRHGPHVVG